MGRPECRAPAPPQPEGDTLHTKTLAALAIAALLGFTGCPRHTRGDDGALENAAEEAGDSAEKAAEKTDDAMQQAGEDAKDAAEKAGDKVEDATDR